MMLGHRAQFRRGLDQHPGEVGGAPRLDAAGVGAGQQQQVADQPAHPPRGAQRGLGGLGLLAGQLLGEQLEVGEHARQRRAQLVGRVGDELPLAVEHRLRVRPGRVQRSQHVLQGPGELGDLVLGLGMGKLLAGVPGPLDLPRGVGQLDDRTHRPLGDEQTGQQGEDRPADHPQQQEHADASERVVDIGQR